ncbi:MAG: DinB family protein [Anaerolineales bacterium]|nr:DinB family protein [Anaerolineales bacterium]
MKDLKTFRKDWNAEQKRLRQLLFEEDLKEAKHLFYVQHKVLHAGEMSGEDAWSYADEVFKGLTESQLRTFPEKEEHSLIWILWHISRIEDVTMNILVADGIQVYHRDNWESKLNSPIQHTGNNIQDDDLYALTRQVNPDQLFSYRIAVGRQTRRVIENLPGEDLAKKPTPTRLERLLTEGAVIPEAEILIRYWSRRKIFQLLLMPPTRHLMVHLNEANSLRKTLIE